MPKTNLYRGNTKIIIGIVTITKAVFIIAVLEIAALQIGVDPKRRRVIVVMLPVILLLRLGMFKLGNMNDRSVIGGM